MSKLKLISLVLFAFCVSTSFAQQTQSKKETIVIQTSGTCQTCKDKIENGLAYEKGIRDVEYDLATAKVKVIYNPQKTTPDAIRSTINKLGFDADDKKVDKKHSGCSKSATKCSGNHNHDHDHNHDHQH